LLIFQAFKDDAFKAIAAGGGDGKLGPQNMVPGTYVPSQAAHPSEYVKRYTSDLKCGFNIFKVVMK
jgi:hypothetical protein